VSSHLRRDWKSLVVTHLGSLAKGEGLFRDPRQKLRISSEVSLGYATSSDRGEQKMTLA